MNNINNSRGNMVMIGLGLLSLLLIAGSIGAYFYFTANKGTPIIDLKTIGINVGQNKMPETVKKEQSTSSASQSQTNTKVNSVSDLDNITKDLDSTDLNVSSDITQ